MPSVREWHVVLGVTLHRTTGSGIRSAFADWHTESRLVARTTDGTTTSTPKVVLGATQARPERILVVAPGFEVLERLRAQAPPARSEPSFTSRSRFSRTY